jgi:hypothetical protein
MKLLPFLVMKNCLRLSVVDQSEIVVVVVVVVFFFIVDDVWASDDGSAVNVLAQCNRFRPAQL